MVSFKQEVILLQKIKNIYPKKTVWIYSGFTFEEIKNGSRASGLYANELLSLCDVLVDGRFIEAQKNISLKFRGSENQRIIDVKKTLQSGNVELYMD